MAYISKQNKRPGESASKSSHSHIINDPSVKAFIDGCEYPKTKDEITLDPALITNINYSEDNPIQYVIAVDGSYSTISVKKTFPSSLITFFQFGELVLTIKDLDEMSEMPFISREAMSKLKELKRSKLVLPTKNVAYKKNTTLTQSVRTTLYEFFKNKDENTSYLETIHWLIFEKYNISVDDYELSSCPNCYEKAVTLKRIDFNSDFINKCKICNKDIYITDVFRLHEAIDDELGASGILGYLTNLIDQISIAHIIKFIKSNKTGSLKHILFIKNGPLGFFGQTANMHKSMRKLCNYLFKNHDLFLAGLEKTGPFVDHADEIKDLLKPGEILLLSNKHIYSYILPNNPDTPEPYAKTSYYSGKLIFKSSDERIYVITIPVENENIVLNPQKSDFRNLDLILQNIEKLKCDMYDNAIVPVALANKLISLSTHPSSYILEKFAKSSIK